MYFYDKNTQGFLVEGLHTIPAGAVKISNELHAELINGQALGKQIVTGKNGLPVLVERQPSPYHQWDGSKWIVDNAKKAEIKHQKQELMRQKINALRDEKNASGVWVEALGHWFDSDADAQRRLAGLSATAADIEKINPEMAKQIAPDWTDAENKVVKSLSQEKRAYIMLAIMQMEQANHQVANQHKDNMLKLDKPEDYDYSSGWAKNYKDYLAEQSNG